MSAAEQSQLTCQSLPLTGRSGAWQRGPSGARAEGAPAQQRCRRAPAAGLSGSPTLTGARILGALWWPCLSSRTQLCCPAATALYYQPPAVRHQACFTVFDMGVRFTDQAEDVVYGGLLPGVLCLTSQLESRASAVFKAANRCKLLLHCTCMGALHLRTMTNSSMTHNGRVKEVKTCP